MNETIPADIQMVAAELACLVPVMAKDGTLNNANLIANKIMEAARRAEPGVPLAIASSGYLSEDNNGGCELAGPGRGDCQHAAGFDGKPCHTDSYGKPIGWCWQCWKSFQIEQLRVQLAGVSTAVMDGSRTAECEQGSYGWSPAYADVLELRRDYDNLVEAAKHLWETMRGYNFDKQRQGALDDLQKIGTARFMRQSHGKLGDSWGT